MLTRHGGSFRERMPPQRATFPFTSAVTAGIRALSFRELRFRKTPGPPVCSTVLSTTALSLRQVGAIAPFTWRHIRMSRRPSTLSFCLAQACCTSLVLIRQCGTHSRGAGSSRCAAARRNFGMSAQQSAVLRLPGQLLQHAPRDSPGAVAASAGCLGTSLPMAHQFFRLDEQRPGEIGMRSFTLDRSCGAVRAGRKQNARVWIVGGQPYGIPQCRKRFDASARPRPPRAARLPPL